MRILVFSEFFLPLTGGGQVILSEICSRLPANETVVYTTYTGDTGWFDERQDYRIIRSDVLSPLATRWPELTEHQRETLTHRSFYGRWFAKSKFIRWLVYVRVILDMVRTALRERPNIVFCGNTFWPAIAARLHAYLRSTPYVVYHFGQEPLLILERGSVLQWVQRWALNGASYLFTISQFSKEVLLKFELDSNRIGIQFPGVSAVFLEANDVDVNRVKLELGLPDDAILLLTVGRLTERKGVDKVLSALPIVMAAFPNVHYLIAGSGQDEYRLRNLAAELDVANRVRFLGDVPHDRLVRYYRACDLFILANRASGCGDVETFGIVFIEANACGKPVIGGRNGGTADAIDDGRSGLLVNPNDENDIADAIRRVLRDRDYAAALGEYGRKRAHERFNWDRNAADVYRVLRAVSQHGHDGAGLSSQSIS